MSRKRKQYPHRRRRYPLPPPAKSCRLCDMEDGPRKVYRYLLRNIVKSFPPGIWSGIGLEKTLVAMEELADKGYIKIGSIESKNPQPGHEDGAFYCLLVWDFFLGKYVRPGGNSRQMKEFMSRIEAEMN